MKTRPHLVLVVSQRVLRWIVLNLRKSCLHHEKTLIFNFDGTGNEPDDAGKYTDDESISNVAKLHILLGGGDKGADSVTKTPAGAKQVLHYYQGIGTRGSNWCVKAINALFAPTGGDVRRILKEAQSDFDRVYIDGDKVVLFGFSRGAALARKFAAEILKANLQCEVAFMGVFDTVAAMNGVRRQGEEVSSDVVFENGTLNPRVKRAVHLVSLDETRTAFAPTLINKDRDNQDRILEAWFPCVHSDIGGGYWFDGLSDNALAFMIDQCKKTLGDAINIADGTRFAEIEHLLRNQQKRFKDCCVDDIVINSMRTAPLHRHDAGK